MNLIERQLELMDTLLRSVSRDAREPEAFKLFFGVFLKDMVNTTGERTGQYWEPEVHFSCLLCRDDQVLAAAIPRRLLANDTRPLFSRQLAALWRVGIPLFADFLTQWKGEDGKVVLNLRSRNCPSPSGWLFPAVCVPQELSGLLYKKGMISDEYSSPDFSMPVPTDYGNQLGLCTTRWYGQNPDGCPRPAAGLYCSTAGWVNRVRLGECPWGGGPDWMPLSLDTRLERMRAGRTGSPGHCMSALLRAMPVAPLLSRCMRNEYIEKYRSKLQALYGPGATYGQAARIVDRLLRSDSGEERAQGMSSLEDLAYLFAYAHKLREAQRTHIKAEADNAIHEASPAGPFPPVWPGRVFQKTAAPIFPWRGTA